MMRFVAVVACLLVALDAAGRAIGETPESILRPEYLWFNWVLVAAWLFNAGYIALRGTDK